MKAQNAIEFVVMLGIVFLVFTAFFTLVSQNFSKQLEKRDHVILQATLDNIHAKIQEALQTEDGFVQTFSTLGAIDQTAGYELVVGENAISIKNIYNEFTQVIFLNEEEQITGELCVGENKLFHSEDYGLFSCCTSGSSACDASFPQLPEYQAIECSVASKVFWQNCSTIAGNQPLEEVRVLCDGQFNRAQLQIEYESDIVFDNVSRTFNLLENGQSFFYFGGLLDLQDPGYIFTSTCYNADLSVQVEVGQDVQSGSVSQYLLNEVTLTGAADEVSDEKETNNATAIAGLTTTTDTPRGQVGVFTATSDHIFIPQDASLEPYAGFTFMAWVNPSSSTLFTGDATIFDRDDANPQVFIEGEQFGIRINNAGHSACNTLGGSTEKNIWSHVAGTWDGSTLTLFVNGSFQSQDTVNCDAITTTTGDSFIGQAADNSDQFIGFLDDVRYYSRALAASEVRQVFLQTKQNGGLTDVTVGLRSHWKLDEAVWAGTSGEVTDEESNAHGTTYGGALTTPSEIRARGGSFDGSLDELIFTDAFNPSVYSISAWVKFDSLSQQSIFVRTAGNPLGTYSHQLRLAQVGPDFRLEHYLYDGASRRLTGTTNIAPDTWYHVVGTAQNSGLMRLYVNGVEEGTPININSLWTAGTQNRIGSHSGDGMGYLIGDVDDVRLYARELTPAEVLAVYDFSKP